MLFGESSSCSERLRPNRAEHRRVQLFESRSSQHGIRRRFVALADDATAAFANPAGLVQLNRPEVSIEGWLWSYATPFTEGGRIFGPPTGIGLDTTPGLRTGISSDALSGLSFLSLVYPKGPASLAVYRHQLANFKAASMTDGLFGTIARRALPVHGFADRH